MVEFEEIKDEQADDVQETVDEGDWSDTSSDISEADAIENESLYDRIVALRDIIPASQRASIARTFSTIYNFGRVTTFIGGKAAYILFTSVLMIGIPFVLSLEEDRALAEQEKQFQLQQGMSEVRNLNEEVC